MREPPAIYAALAAPGQRRPSLHGYHGFAKSGKRIRQPASGRRPPADNGLTAVVIRATRLTPRAP